MAEKAKVGFFKRISKFFRGIITELKKVSWPNRKELGNYTAIVLTIGTLTAAAMGLFDYVFKQVFVLLASI